MHLAWLGGKVERSSALQEVNFDGFLHVIYQLVAIIELLARGLSSSLVG